MKFFLQKYIMIFLLKSFQTNYGYKEASPPNWQHKYKIDFCFLKRKLDFLFIRISGIFYICRQMEIFLLNLKFIN